MSSCLPFIVSGKNGLRPSGTEKNKEEDPIE